MASREYINKIKEIIDPDNKMPDEQVTRIALTLLKFYKTIEKIMKSEAFQKEIESPQKIG